VDGVFFATLQILGLFNFRAKKKGRRHEIGQFASCYKQAMNMKLWANLDGCNLEEEEEDDDDAHTHTHTHSLSLSLLQKKREREREREGVESK